MQSQMFTLILSSSNFFPLISSSRHHRQTQHRYTLHEDTTKIEIQNAANMVEFFFRSQAENDIYNKTVTEILQHGCFCKQLKHNRMNDKENKAEVQSPHDDICEYNRLCTECSRHEAFDIYADVAELSDASCRQPYPYVITIDDCGNIVCDDLVNPCQQAKCECDLKTARDLFSVREQKFEKTMCRAVEIEDTPDNTSATNCCGNNSLYIKYAMADTCEEEAGFPKVIGKSGKTDLLKKYHSIVKKEC